MAPPAALPDSMEAQFLDAFNTPYALRSVPLPALTSPHDMLIRVDAASYCHTDAVLAAGQMAPHPPSFPHISCHEFAGTVVALPPDPDQHQNQDPSSSSSDWHMYKIGDRVGVPGRAYHPCGSCFECLPTAADKHPHSDLANARVKGYSPYCPHALNLGISTAGGFAQYALVDARQIAFLPDEISAVDAAALMCAGLTIYAALKRCGLQKRQMVGIMGCGGGLGHLGVGFAMGMGLRVVGVEVGDGALEVARGVVRRFESGGGEESWDGKEEQKGVRIVDARVEDAEEVVRKLGEEDGKKDRGDMGVDAVIILPESQKAFDYGVGLLRNHGRCVVVSFPQGGFHLSARDLVFRDVSVVGSLVGSNEELREMLQFAAEHGIRPSAKTFPLTGLNELVEEYHNGGGGKLVVDMHFGE